MRLLIFDDKQVQMGGVHHIESAVIVVKRDGVAETYIELKDNKVIMSDIGIDK